MSKINLRCWEPLGFGRLAGLRVLPRTLLLPGTSLRATTGAITPTHPSSSGVKEGDSLSGCEHRINLGPVQCHLNRTCTERIRQDGRFCLNVCDVFWVRQHSRIQRFSGYSDLGPGRTKAVLIGVTDLLQLGLFIIGQLKPFPKAASHRLLSRPSWGFPLICGAWISGLGEQMRGVCRCQEGYSNFLHRGFVIKIVRFRDVSAIKTCRVAAVLPEELPEDQRLVWISLLLCLNNGELKLADQRGHLGRILEEGPRSIYAHIRQRDIV